MPEEKNKNGKLPHSPDPENQSLPADNSNGHGFRTINSVEELLKKLEK